MNDGADDVVQNTFLQLIWTNRALHSLDNRQPISAAPPLGRIVNTSALERSR